MFIPTTKEEFIKDIKSSCGIVSNANEPVSAIFSLYSTIFGILDPDLIKKHMRAYGIEPIILARRDKEDIDHYLSRLWEANSQLILSNSGRLTLNDRNALLGSDLARKQWVKEWLLEQEGSTEWNNGWFSKLPYHERKYLMPVRSLEDYELDAPDIQRFRISHIPEDVQFGECFPTINELYIAHPHKPGVYLPVSRYEHLLLRERIHEMSKVMMALGATEIRTIQNDESRSYSKEDSSSRTSGSVGVGRWASGSGSYATGAEHARSAEQESEIVINFKNDPIKLPYIPKDLVWFNHENEWQQIAESRLNGNILEYELRLSSKQVNLVSDHERSNIEAQAKILLASGSFSRETSSSSIFKEETAKSTSILIKFKSRKDY